MPLGSEIAVLEGLGGLGEAVPWAPYSRVVGLNTTQRRNVIDPSEGANYSGGSDWTGGMPLTPSSQGLADEQVNLERGFAAFEAPWAPYSDVIGLNTTRRRNVIDPSEGANYSGGSDWTGGMPLTPSSQGLADDPYPEMTSYLNEDGGGTLPTRRNVVSPGGGALYDGGASYTPGMPFMMSSQGLVGLGAYPDDYFLGLAAVAEDQKGKAGKLDDKDRAFAVRLGSFLSRFKRPMGQARAQLLLTRLRQKLGRTSDEGLKQRLTRRMALLTQVITKIQNPNVKEVRIASDRPVAVMRNGQTKPLEACFRPFDRAGAAVGTAAASARSGLSHGFALTEEFAPSLSLDGLDEHFAFPLGELDATLTGLDESSFGVFDGALGEAAPGASDLELAVRAAASPTASKPVAQAIEAKAGALERLAKERAAVVTKSRADYDGLLRDIERMDRRVTELAKMLLGSDGAPLPKTTPGQLRQLEGLLIERRVAAERALDFARVNMLATGMARNAQTQAALARTIAESVRMGSPLAVATLVPMFAHLGKVSAEIRNLREKQRATQEKKSDADAYQALLRRKATRLEQLAQITRDASTNRPFTETQKAALRAVEADLQKIGGALRAYHPQGLGELDGWFRRKLKKAFKETKKGLKGAASATGGAIKKAAQKTYAKAVKPVGHAVKVATKQVAKGLGKIVDFSCRMANSTVMRTAKSVVGQAVGGVVGTIYGGNPEMGRRAGALVAERANSIDKAACGSIEKVGITKGKFDARQAGRELKKQGKAVVRHHLDFKGAARDVGKVVGGSYYDAAKKGIEYAKHPKQFTTRKGLKNFLITSHKDAVKEGVKQYAKEYAGEAAAKYLENAPISVPQVAKGVELVKKVKKGVDTAKSVKADVEHYKKEIESAKKDVQKAKQTAEHFKRELAPKRPAKTPAVAHTEAKVKAAEQRALKIEAEAEAAAGKLRPLATTALKFKGQMQIKAGPSEAELLVAAAGA